LAAQAIRRLLTLHGESCGGSSTGNHLQIEIWERRCVSMAEENVRRPSSGRCTNNHIGEPIVIEISGSAHSGTA
jgi:hypothetical protein